MKALRRSVSGALLAIGATALISACGSQPGGTDGDVWTGTQTHIDCCATTRLPSPDSTKTLVFEPDDDERAHVRLSAGWLRQLEVAVLEGPAAASWAPDSESFFISDGEGSGQTSTFRLFRAPNDGSAREIPAAHAAAVSAYRSHVRCPAEAFDPEVWGLGWSRDGSRAVVLVQASIHEPCGSASNYMVMALATDDGELVEQYDTAEAARRFADLIPANVLDVTTP